MYTRDKTLPMVVGSANFAPAAENLSTIGGFGAGRGKNQLGERSRRGLVSVFVHQVQKTAAS